MDEDESELALPLRGYIASDSFRAYKSSVQAMATISQTEGIRVDKGDGRDLVLPSIHGGPESEIKPGCKIPKHIAASIGYETLH